MSFTIERVISICVIYRFLTGSGKGLMSDSADDLSSDSYEVLSSSESPLDELV